MDHKTLRKALRERFGSRNYRITRHGEVHVYGLMPNTDKIGWYLIGYLGDADLIYRVGACRGNPYIEDWYIYGGEG